VRTGRPAARRRPGGLNGPVRAAVLATAVAVSVSVAASALAAAPSGDPSTIALYKSIAANTNAQPAVQIAQTGYMTLSSRPGAKPAFAYRFGYGSVPKGYVRASEAITYVQLLGRVVWVTDVISPVVAACAPGAPCPPPPDVPIELLITKAGAFAGLARGATHAVACFDRESFNGVPYRAGEPWWSAVGDFRPKVTRGNQTLVTVTYAWADGQHVTEVDSIDVGRRIFAASAIHVARGALAAQVAFSFAQRDSLPSVVPHAPRVTLCR